MMIGDLNKANSDPYNEGGVLMPAKASRGGDEYNPNGGSNHKRPREPTSSSC